MSTIEPEFPPLDIVTPYGTATRLPTSFPLIDPELDSALDPDHFQQGFDDAITRLESLPAPWARQLASTTMAAEPDPDLTEDDRSYTRGYRAALYGYLRHST
ncbi:hypothetical protein QSJ18_06655 [Gordonia sp. ABSL1-1]|uniref:hypothetical protein n=1 Tax=Gordonia sp. ABSL1-1 TaxID=3053923 RepID=UPI002573B372|nr:hypothetical protein [Gordonia sp. ABSL1-1]MDL9936416.1 hypothetical protein [Gordonia sp. ABSL1-1]